jgi:hypothetical protein
MTGISERQSLTREEKFVALVHIYAELRLPFDAALDAAEADLLREQNEGPERGRTAVRDDGVFYFTHPSIRHIGPKPSVKRYLALGHSPSGASVQDRSDTFQTG